MTVFWDMLLAHLLTDFVFKRKEVYGASFGYIAFSGFLYFAVLALCCFKFLSAAWFELPFLTLNGWAVIAIAAFIYFLANLYGKYFSVPQRLRFPFFIFRQTAYLLFLFILSPVLPFEGNFVHYMLGPDLLIIANSCLIVTFGFSAFLVALSYSLNDGVCNQGLFDKRFLNMLFRLIIFLLLIIPGILFPAMAFILVILAAYYGLFKDEKKYLYTGCIMTAAFAFLIRGVFC